METLAIVLSSNYAEGEKEGEWKGDVGGEREGWWERERVGASVREEGGRCIKHKFISHI